MEHNHENCGCQNNPTETKEEHTCSCHHHEQVHQCGCGHHHGHGQVPEWPVPIPVKSLVFDINSPEVVAYIGKPYKRMLHQYGTQEKPRFVVEILEFDGLLTESDTHEGAIEQSIIDMKTYIADRFNKGLSVPEPGEISEHRIPRPKPVPEQEQPESYELPPLLDLTLQEVSSTSWTFGNSGFALVYEGEPDEYYLIDLVNGEADEGEAVNVFRFPNKQKTKEQELEGIQEWFSIFYHGFGYAYTKQYRMQTAIENNLIEELQSE